MKVLALDLGTKCGWALSGVSEQACSGTWDMSNGRFAGGGMRFVKFRSILNTAVTDAGGVDMVFFEEVRRHLGVDAAHAYGGYLAILSAYCEEKSIPYQGVPVQSIKKHATNKGNASKQDVFNAAREKWPHVKTEDEADALWLLDLAKKEYAE